MIMMQSESMHHADGYGKVLSSTGYGACNVDVRKAIRVVRLAQCGTFADKSQSCFRHKRKRLRLKHQPQAVPHKHGIGKHSSAQKTWGQNPLTIIHTGMITNRQHKIIYTVPAIRTGNLFIFVAAANTDWLMEKSSFATNNFDFSEEWGEAKLSVNAC